jgi:hypothetical protein
MPIDKLSVEYTVFIPDELEEGILYVSREYKIAIHLCACGCRGKTVTPLKNWTITTHEDNTITLRPSIGNWLGENPYHAHYFITRSTIEWC